MADLAPPVSELQEYPSLWLYDHGPRMVPLACSSYTYIQIAFFFGKLTRCTEDLKECMCETERDVTPEVLLGLQHTTAIY